MPLARSWSTVAKISSVASAICWMPSPLYSRRNSSIWLCSSWDSFSGIRILSSGAVIARERSAVPLGIFEAAVVVVLEDLAVAVTLGARGCEAAIGDLGAARRGAAFGLGPDIAGEADEDNGRAACR